MASPDQIHTIDFIPTAHSAKEAMRAMFHRHEYVVFKIPDNICHTEWIEPE